MRSLVQLLARILATTVNLGIVKLDMFRRVHFKGKPSIARELSPNIFPKDGVYKCGDVWFDIDFSDGIQRYVYPRSCLKSTDSSIWT